MKNIFIIGSKGIPAKYGGFETFVDKLTEHKKNENIKYHISCLAEDEREFEYNGARCFNVKVSDIGSAKAITYDLGSLKKVIEYIKANNLSDCIVYILACRIGPFFHSYKKQLERLGAKVYVNPDGHEWKRSKWNRFIRWYWKYSEKLMVKHVDLLVCDSVGIEKYIKEEYSQFSPKTTFIAYGADIEASKVEDDSDELLDWYKKHKITKNQYYLIVGRFVPENNYETMIREFKNSNTDKDLVIITNFEENKFSNELKEKTGYTNDKRIKFVGTLYDQELLKKIRENAYAYIHGHEVGGTNPSLLEALASTKVNLLLDVIFNKEVGQDGALYFTKQLGALSKLINQVDSLSQEGIAELESKAKKLIAEAYSWDYITKRYEELFTE